MRERTHADLRRRRDGCGVPPHGGHAPNFSLYLCAAQPRLVAALVGDASQHARASGRALPDR